MTHRRSPLRPSPLRPSPLRPSRRAILAGGLGLAAFGGPARAEGPAARIASLGGAVTEILYRLGAAGRIVVVDTTSIYPAQVLREKPNVGYLRALSAEGLLSAGPDLVIAAEGAGPADVLTLVREAGVPVSIVKEPPTPEGVLDKIATVGRLAGLDREAAALAGEVRAQFAGLSAQRARITRPARALVVLSVANGRVMVGGRNSTADGILALAGVENAATGIEGFKPMTDEAIVAAAPDAVVMMQNGAEAPNPETTFAPGTALGQVPAAARRALVAMDGLYLLGFGPRTPDAAHDLIRAIYPDLIRG
ncbi:hemin ABC transporter substrate-binding protein [Methylobacterium sp. E-045]|uniref:heme/hemin ABC transporter substrate-binding protein n=1 Tax=Methylobacterium sp. E-045 TaxID=2836575 RepID=UPI001FB8F8E9|nr:ABC transporter substrate-binding protein [Methylobacterium sp. E-045]MCJ2130790.1 ABC transporter substrate-binding protein [Methylobacterium sp. E-045]